MYGYPFSSAKFFLGGLQDTPGYLTKTKFIKSYFVNPRKFLKLKLTIHQYQNGF